MNATLQRAADTALRQIAKYGEPCVWQQSGVPVVADPTKPFVKTNSAAVSTPVAILFRKRSTAIGTGVELAKSDAILAANGALVPKLEDTVVRSDGTKLALKIIDVIAPNGAPILYELTFQA